MVKFKLTSTTAGSLFEIYGNKSSSTSINFVKVSITTQNINLLVSNASAIISASTSTTPLSTNIWYSLVLTFNSGGHSITLNGTSVSLNYTTGTSASQFSPSLFSSILYFVGVPLYCNKSKIPFE